VLHYLITQLNVYYAFGRIEFQLAILRTDTNAARSQTTNEIE
jgi:hypothetical protein